MKKPISIVGVESTSKRVALVSTDVYGLVTNGGVGTACLGLAEALASAGNQVTLFFVDCFGDSSPNWDHWVSWYQEKGIALVRVTECEVPLEALGPRSGSYKAYQFLKRNNEQADFDVIYFNDFQGLAYYSLQAKNLTGEFANTPLCVLMHGPSEWHESFNNSAGLSMHQIERRFLERQSIEKCDAIVAPSQYILDWARLRGWHLPNKTSVIPNILPRTNRVEVCREEYQRPETIAFFGRFEFRKGYDILLEALRLLAPEMQAKPKVLFLGKHATTSSGASAFNFKERLNSLGWQVEVAEGLNSEEAIFKLIENRALAVFPTRSESMGMGLAECIENGIPAVVSKIPVHAEMLEELQDHSSVFDLTPSDLAKCLSLAFSQGVTTLRRKVGNFAAVSQWLQFHNGLVNAQRDKSEVVDVGDRVDVASHHPMVSVCVPHFDRPSELRECLRSIDAQTYPIFEIWVGNDGSQNVEVLSQLEKIGRKRRGGAVKVLHSSDRSGPGVVRNRLARLARGEYLFFLDDDNQLFPQAIEASVRAAIRTNADMVCGAFDRAHITDNRARIVSRWLPLGAALSMGFFENVFGDMNSLLKKSSFKKIGGLNETFGLIGEDWDLFARMIFAGMKLEILPQPLVLYRENGIRYSQQAHRGLSQKILLETYLRRMNQTVTEEVLAGAADLYASRSLPSPWYQLEPFEVWNPSEARGLTARPMFDSSNQSWIDEVTNKHNVEVQPKDRALEVRSMGGDPHFALKNVELTGSDQVAIQVLATGYSPTFFKIYYQTKDRPYFCEDQMVFCPIRPGENKFSLRISDQNLYGPLRLDPLETEGRMFIHHLQVLSLDQAS